MHLQNTELDQIRSDSAEHVGHIMNLQNSSNLFMLHLSY